MRGFVCMAIGTALLASVAAAEEGPSGSAAEETVPATVEDGARTVKEGGQEIGEGFRGIGRGVKDVFRGEESKDDFQEAEKIGTGTRALGRGTAGVVRGVGHGIKNGFGDEGESGESRRPPIEEEAIDE